jgi:hypothetical protein
MLLQPPKAEAAVGEHFGFNGVYKKITENCLKNH